MLQRFVPESDVPTSRNGFFHSNLPRLHSADRYPRRYEKRRADRTTHSGEYDRVFERTLAISNDPASQRRPRQRCNRRNSKYGPGANANILDRRDTCAEGRRESDAGTGANTEESGEQDNEYIARGWEPQAEDEDSGERSHDDHYIEAAYFVGERIGDSTAEDAADR